MKVFRPSTGKMTCDPICHGYKAYDFTDNIIAPFDCEIVLSSDGESRNWQAFTKNDPYKNVRNGVLLTQDYGNFFKAKGKDCFWLVAHLPDGSVPSLGTKLKKSQIVGYPGNTGNSTGTHGHHEFRDLKGINIEVEFESTIQPQPIGGDDAVTDDEKRSLQVLENFFKTSTDSQGKPFGNLEGYANTLAQDAYKAWKNLPQPTNQISDSLWETIKRLFGR